MRERLITIRLLQGLLVVRKLRISIGRIRGGKKKREEELKKVKER